MNENEIANEQELVTEDSNREAVLGVTSADPKSVDDKEVQNVQETEQELVASVPTEEVAAEEDTPAAETNEEEAPETNVEDTEVSEEDATDEDASEEADSTQGTSDFNFSDYIDNIPQIKRGATVKGVIVRYDDENVFVDVKDKSEGKISRREFDNDPEFDLDQAIAEKKPIEVYVKNIKNSDQGKEILLSKARVDFTKYKEQVEKAFQDKEPIEVKVVRVVKDGIIAAYGGVEIYIHRTQLDFQVVENLEDYLNQDITILVTQFDADRRRLRVSGSRRTLLNQDRKKRAEELWESIAVGDIYEGVVRNITNFGAFVDIGGVDGLVHISELSWDRIKHPSEVIAVNDVIQVYVKDFDQEKKRISLGYKKIEDDPYHNIEERYPVGTIVTGKVVRMFNFGAFVEIEEGIDALCHISQISNRRLEKPGDVLKEGQEVDARILDVSNDERKISISIKDVQPIDELIGEAAEREDKKQEKQDKKKKDRAPSSYQDANQSESRTPSDMELAFAAARAAQEQADDSVDSEEENVEASDEANEEVVDSAVETGDTAVEADTETSEEELDEVESAMATEVETFEEETSEKLEASPSEDGMDEVVSAMATEVETFAEETSEKLEAEIKTDEDASTEVEEGVEESVEDVKTEVETVVEEAAEEAEDGKE